MYPTIRRVDPKTSTRCLQRAVKAGYLNWENNIYTAPLGTFQWAMDLIKKDRRVCWLYVEMTGSTEITLEFILTLIVQILAGGDWGDPAELMPGIDLANGNGE